MTAAPSRTAASPSVPSLFAQLSIRNKLLALVLLPLAGVLPLLGAILLGWSSVALDRVLVTKIRADLAVAQGYFERTLAEVGASAGAIAESRALHEALAQPPEAVAPLLEQLRRRERLDFVNLRHADGTLRATQDGPASGADPQSPAYRAVGGGDHTSVEVLSLAQLQRLHPAGAARVAVPLVPTRNAQPTTRTVEDRALVLLSTRAVRSASGQLLGHVQAGVLLNRNLDFIDHINAIVYPEGSLPFTELGSRGTATLFLDDVRISTNVRLFADAAGRGGERAIGTRVSRTVRDTVLGEGRTWLDRAFVVDEWYVSGYMPLQDHAGQRVGMLYVGFLERPFVWLKYGALTAIGVVYFAVMVLAAWVSLRWARAIFAPLERMDATMARVEAGAIDARVGPLGDASSADEIGALARHLDQLLDTVGDKTAELQRLNAALDAKVAERTRELEAAHEQLVKSEKMATVGQLTAGIAHEVNNPVAVMQGNLDLVRQILGPAAAPVKAELALVDQQIERIRLIVTRLLQYARPGDYAGYVEPVALELVLEDCLVLAAHLLARTQIVVAREFRATRPAAGNRQELQQVCVNLIVNAIHAMPDGGTLTLATRDAPEDRVEIVVSDTGPGIAPELRQRLFSPFVTTKPGGTGLGLWISRNLLERHGGELLAGTAAAGGAAFTVRLPAARPDRT
jgi:signal transduction histidine kinase